MAATSALVPQTSALVASTTTTNAAALTSQLITLVAFTNETVDDNTADTSQVATLVAYATETNATPQAPQVGAYVAWGIFSTPKVSQTGIYAAWKEGQREDLTIRAWSFDFDGHTFYVLSLGMQGTWVYDLSTQTWSEWRTEGYVGWNAEVGQQWQKGLAVAGDVENPIVWTVNPDQTLDQGFKQLTRVATSFIPAQGRGTVAVNAVYIDADQGSPQADANETSTITLSISDDQGSTFFDLSAIEILSGDATQVLEWRSIGTFGTPGRVFKVTDVGGPVRLSNAWVEVSGDGGLK